MDGILELRVLAGQHGAPVLQAATGCASLTLLGPRERRRARILSDQKPGWWRRLLRGLLLRGWWGLLGRLHERVPGAHCRLQTHRHLSGPAKPLEEHSVLRLLLLWRWLRWLAVYLGQTHHA